MLDPVGISAVGPPADGALLDEPFEERVAGLRCGADEAGQFVGGPYQSGHLVETPDEAFAQQAGVAHGVSVSVHVS